MTNEQLAKKIDEFLPFWEKEENCYKTTLETLNRNDTRELQEAYNYFVDMYGADEILNELNKRLNNKKIIARQQELLRQKNAVIKFMNKHNQNFEGLELIDFLQANDIEYMYFENIKDLFNYYTEENYNALIFDKVIFIKDGSIIILQCF